MQLSAALEFAMETPQASLCGVMLHWLRQCSNSPAGLPPAGYMLQVYHLQHIVAYFLLMHHNEVVVHKLQVYHLQIVVHEVYHLMHHLLCYAGRRPANENEDIFWIQHHTMQQATPVVELVYHQLMSICSSPIQ